MRAPMTMSGFFNVRTSIAVAGVLFVALACEEKINAPGACPDFCPVASIEVLDTVLMSAVNRDSAFRGYSRAQNGLRMQVTTSDAEVLSRGIVRFLKLPDSILIGSTNRPIVSIDSYTVRVELRKRSLSVSNLEVLVHRIPGSIDSNTTYDDLAPYFEDSTIVGTLAVGDTVQFDSLFIPLVPDAFPNLEADDYTAAVAFSVRASAPTYAAFGTIEAGVGARLTRFAKIDSLGGEITEHSDVRGANFDSFVNEAEPLPPGDILAVGGRPAARSLLRLSVPQFILDSTEVVGAKLYLIPIAAAVGAPGDSFRVQVDALSADFGPKSPLVSVATTLDSASLLPGRLIAVGSMDTVVLDLTDALRGWQSDSTRPHSVMVRIAPTEESSTIGQLFVGSSRYPGAIPWLTITYVPPFKFEGQ